MMSRISKTFAAAIVLLAAGIWATPATAQAPCGLPQGVGHFLGGWIANCADDQPVGGLAEAQDPAGNIVTTLISDIVCEDTAGQTQGGPCDTITGAGGRDGNVAVSGNWANPGVSGCPNPTNAAGFGRNVITVRDRLGNGVVMSVGYSADFGAYLAEGAHQFDPVTFEIFPLHCRPTSAGSAPVPQQATSECLALIGTASVSADGTTASMAVTPMAPTVLTDCESGTLGQALGSCTEGSLALASAGNLYKLENQPCSGPGDFRRTSWTPTTSPVTVQKPAGADMCSYIGATMNFLGRESASLVCAVSVAGQLAASPKALDVLAARDKGGIVLTWRTQTELGLSGFNVLGISKRGEEKLNLSIIPAAGNGAGFSYEYRLSMPDLKDSHAIVIESLLKSGGAIRSGTVDFTKGAKR